MRGCVKRGISIVRDTEQTASYYHEQESSETPENRRISVDPRENMSAPIQHQKLGFELPAEIRNQIMEYVFADFDDERGLNRYNSRCIDENHSASRSLQPLLVCKQMYHDGRLLAFNRSTFLVSNLFFHVPDRLSVLCEKQTQAIGSIAFLADARHFRKLVRWGEHPFGLSTLNLTTLTIILHRSSFWHYLFDYTSDLVKLLRNLTSVKRLVFIRNGARVKGSFKTWYNRLVGLMLKVDHYERYERATPNLETTWWTWSYDEAGESFCLEARPSKPLVSEEEYLTGILPLMEGLRVSIESEEWNPDPRARNGA